MAERLFWSFWAYPTVTVTSVIKTENMARFAARIDFFLHIDLLLMIIAYRMASKWHNLNLC